METIEYRWDWKAPDLWTSREKWPPGPWDDEPDKIQYPDPETGLACVIRRHARLGFLCGYVGVPPGHPLYGEDDVYEGGDEDVIDLLALEGAPEVNYAAACDVDGDEAEAICHVPGPGEPEPLWWFGFDNGHGGQLAPGLAEINREVAAEVRLRYPEWPASGDDVYATVETVKEQCAVLARALAAYAK